MLIEYFIIVKGSDVPESYIGSWHYNFLKNNFYFIYQILSLFCNLNEKVFMMFGDTRKDENIIILTADGKYDTEATLE